MTNNFHRGLAILSQSAEPKNIQPVHAVQPSSLLPVTSELLPLSVDYCFPSIASAPAAPPYCPSESPFHQKHVRNQSVHEATSQTISIAIKIAFRRNSRCSQCASLMSNQIYFIPVPVAKAHTTQIYLPQGIFIAPASPRNHYVFFPALPSSSTASSPARS